MAVSLSELEALARGVSGDPRIRMVAGAPGTGWSIDLNKRIVHADPVDMTRLDADHLRGLAVHEAAHAVLTRIPDLIPVSVLDEPGMAGMLNAIEDTRIESWMLARFPGASRWVSVYNDRLLTGAIDPLHPRFVGFALGWVRTWWTGEIGDDHRPEVADALRRTAEARTIIARTHPLAEPGAAELARSYAGSNARKPWIKADSRAEPDDVERAIRESAWRAWAVIWEQVVPELRRLVAADVRDAEALQAHDRALCRRLRALGAVTRTGEKAEGDGGEGVTPERRRAAERVVTAGPADVYETARRRVAPLLHPLVQELERTLQPVERTRLEGRHASGARVDLRAAMRSEADPGGWDQLWNRRTVPHRRDPVVLLLLDVSGSMAGERIERAFEGVVLLTEVLSRMNIPFAVHGFQDELIPLLTFGAPLDAYSRARLATLRLETEGRRPGGHNRPEHNHDGPVLEKAARVLAWAPGQERILIVVTDGQPSGPGHEGEAMLRQAIARVSRSDLHLVGIGLGPGTEAVAGLYPDGFGGVPLDDFPAALGELLERRLLGTWTEAS